MAWTGLVEIGRGWGKDAQAMKTFTRINLVFTAHLSGLWGHPTTAETQETWRKGTEEGNLMHVSAFMCISQGRLGEASLVVRPSQGPFARTASASPQIARPCGSPPKEAYPLSPKTKPNQLSFPGDATRGNSVPLG